MMTMPQDTCFKPVFMTTGCSPLFCYRYMFYNNILFTTTWFLTRLFQLQSFAETHLLFLRWLYLHKWLKPLRRDFDCQHRPQVGTNKAMRLTELIWSTIVFVNKCQTHIVWTGDKHLFDSWPEWGLPAVRERTSKGKLRKQKSGHFLFKRIF